MDWFGAHKRPLPFRETRDPYKIWVSEILAQQTRIAAMLPFYQRFVERFPAVGNLADAPLDDVLALWAGMGYYARARNLHAAARVVRDQYGGVLPDTAEALRALPGIGAYTAGAIASIAFGLPEPAIDGNVRRVYARLFADGDGSAAEAWVRSLMSGAMEAGHSPGEITEALMELGALVCLPQTPRCAECPLEPECKAKRTNTIGRFPIRPVKKEKSVEYRDIVAVNDENRRYLMRKRTESILRGMLEFPEQTTLNRDGFTVTDAEPWIEAEHIFTHRVWRMRGYRARVAPPSQDALPDGYRWVSVAEMETLAIPGAMRAFVTALKTAERARRWRLLLGAEAVGGEAPAGDDANMDAALRAVYDGQNFSYGPDGGRKSSKNVAGWVDIIQREFPEEAVNVMINDAIGRHNIESLLLRPNALRAAPRDAHTAAFLLRNRSKIPRESREAARQIVRAVTDEMRRKLELKLHSAAAGTLNRRARGIAPGAVDWHGTIRKNLGRYNAQTRVITPDRFLFFERGQRRAPYELWIFVDQSASMAHSAMTAVTAAAVLAGVPALRTKLFAFDTEVTDLCGGIDDPVETLFQLRFTGGTDIANALQYVANHVTQPQRTALLVVSDLQDGGEPEHAAAQFLSLTQSGIKNAVLMPCSAGGALPKNGLAAQISAEAGTLCAAAAPDALPDVVARLLSR